MPDSTSCERPGPVSQAGRPAGAPPAEIAARAVCKLYGDFPALRNVSFELSSGAFLGLMGRNGAGKTTLLKLLALLTSPSSGSLSIAGMDPHDEPLLLRRRIGFLGHNSFLYDELTAEENLLFYASLYQIGPARQICAEMLERVGLKAVAHSPVRQFSRGMRQRLAVARLFLHRPDLLLLDEPFTGLDDRAAQLLEGLLREAQQQAKTIVLCTHQIEQALGLADQLLILDRGQVRYYGPNHSDQPAQMMDLYRRSAG